MTKPISIPLSDRYMAAILGYFVALKLIISFGMSPLGDEAYYWLWGQHIAMSYFDHPGLAGWVLGLGDAVFGNSLIGLRIMSVLSSIGSIGFFWLYAKRVAPNNQKSTMLFTTLMVAASPTLFIWTILVYHDHLLVFLTLGSMYFFTCYLGDAAKQQTGKLTHLYSGAVILGFAGLTKYSAVFLGLAVALLIIGHPKLRGLLRNVHLYVAGAISVVMQLPTLYWNFRREFASFEFHLNDRHGSNWLDNFNSDSFFNFVLVTILLFGPFLFPSFIRLFANKTSTGFEEIGVWLARLVALMSTGTFMFIALFSFTLWYWSDLTYILLIAMLPLLGIRKWLAHAHVWFGLVIVTLVTFNYVVVPIPNLMGARDKEAATVYNWNEVAEFVRNAEAIHNPDFVASSRFQLASQISFALGRPDITSIEVRPTQFDIWEDRYTIAGQMGLVLQDEFGQLGEVKKRFETLVKVDELTIERFGYPLLKYELYLGTNYTPRPTNLVQE